MPNSLNDDIFDIVLKRAFDKYAEQVANDHPLELPQEDEARIDIGKKRVYKEVKRHIARSKRVRYISTKRVLSLIAIITIIGILFAANATAFKSFVLKTYTSIQGNVMKISADYAELDKKYETISKFDKSNLIIPSWIPNNTHLVNIEDNETYVLLQYEIGDKYLDLFEYTVDLSENNYNVQLENNDFKERQVKILGIDGILLERKYESGLNNKIVVWSTDNIKYRVETDLSNTELMNILAGLKFFEY